jgi:cytochrome d ubiquinol oxidase subunit II
MTHVLDLVPIWTLILGMAVFFYVLLDGFDLGVGMLYGLAPDTSSRNTIMNTVAPIWDGNETWLILGGLRAAGRVSARFRHHHPGCVFPDPSNAAGAHLPRCRLRIPVSGREE